MAVTRRRVIQGIAGAAGFAAVGGWGCVTARRTPPTDQKPLVVDVHCHLFNAKDVPVAGFMNRFLLGLGVPAAVVSVLGGTLRGVERWGQDRSSGAEELASLQALVNGQDVPPRTVAPLRADELMALDAGFPPDALVPPAQALAAAAARNAERERVLAQAYATDPQVKQWFDGLPVQGAQGFIEMQEAGLPFLARVLAYFYSGFGGFISTGIGARLDVARKLISENPGASVFMPLMLDFDGWIPSDAAPAPVSPETQVQLMATLAQAAALGRLPLPGGGTAALHPMVAYDPKRDVTDPSGRLREYRDLLEQTDRWTALDRYLAKYPDAAGEPASFGTVRRAIATGAFVGVKVYPPVGFRPLGNSTTDQGLLIDVALRRLYAWCQRNDVPITCHAGTGNAFSPEAKEMAAPAGWGPVLDLHDQLRLNLGHFGHESLDWLDDAVRLLQKPGYAHAYADIADADIQPAHLAMHIAQLRAHGVFSSPAVMNHLMYGSDWFMDKLNPGGASQYLQTLEAAVGAEVPPATLERFLGTNALEFLGLNDPASGNSRRLRQFYAGLKVSPPRWLAGG
jgi:amidohydrolase family protein